MCKTILLLGGVFLLAAVPQRAAAQTFDTSGTGSLQGQYLFRYVNFFNDTSGNLTESCSLSGVITFDGAGNYTTSNTQLFDSAGTGTGSCAPLGGGTYGVQSNGLAQLDNPLYSATLFGTFSQPLVIASSTEDYYFDLFIAVQAPATASNRTFSGNYTVGILDFLNASNSLARQGYFNLSADGNGNIGAFTVDGSAANLSSNTLTQSVAASAYSLAGATGGTVTFPGTSGDQTQIVSGAKLLYVSADGNFAVGGAADGSDMFFGFRAPSGTSSNSMLSGTYFIAGMDNNLSSSFLDGFYGSINTKGDGNLFWHSRTDDVVDEFVYDDTFNTPITLGSDGSYFDGTFNYFAGVSGKAIMLIGSGQQYSLNVGIHSPSITPTSTVWINPVGITNAANYTPITNAYSPGELISIYGNFGVDLNVNKKLPIPTTLSNVQVLVNGQAAPIYFVSPNQISTLIPYEVSGEYFASFQVVVNGSKSNSVTVYVDNTSPGIYTLPENGIGPGAILHADYSEVTDSDPAIPGETVLLFMNGLGTVTPPVDDGAAASSVSLSRSDESSDITVSLDDGVDALASANVSFAGLAPGFAGLYQVNFALPTTGIENGDVFINFGTDEAVNEMATIRVSGFSQTTAQVSSHLRSPRVRSKMVRGTSHAHKKSVKNHRRALPERQAIK